MRPEQLARFGQAVRHREYWKCALAKKARARFFTLSKRKGLASFQARDLEVLPVPPVAHQGYSKGKSGGLF